MSPEGNLPKDESSERAPAKQNNSCLLVTAMIVKIYTTRTCPYCHAAKALLKQRGLDFEEIDVSDDNDFDKLVARTGMKTVPQIFFDEKLIGGFQELAVLDSSGKPGPGKPDSGKL